MSWAHVSRAVVVGSVLALVGCKPVVREDRTITFDSSGRAAFQHGSNGVFVTDPKTGLPRRIYDATPEDLAFSPPAWEPGGKRMVFTVARALDGKRPEPLGDAPADGRRYSAIPVRYTCWLYDPSANGVPEKLFDAVAGHAGSVAAGLAACWHPDGQRLDFIDRTDAQSHYVRTFDIATHQTTTVPLSAAENVVLGSDPGRPTRYAVLGGTGVETGLWVEGTRGEWWRVPASEPRSAQLEDLRRQLPRWSRDGNKLAFTDGTELRITDVTTRTTRTWYRLPKMPPDPNSLVPHQLTGFHWYPDGTRIGVIEGARLGLVASTGWSKTLTDAPVVSFAGWNAAGNRMAYVTTEPLPYSAAGSWATLLVPNADARTAVRVADADGANEKVLVSGLRATFPHWSPAESRLSLWLTVEPPYSFTDGNGMPPGDPAALIDPETGKLDWLPVNGNERAQIGHVELRGGNVEAALRQYDAAAAGLRADEKADWMIFRAIAFQNVGRADAARDAWNRFEPAVGPGAGAPLADAEVIRARHRFIAEAFVSLELLPDGIERLRAELASAASDTDRLSATLALCQLLLLADRKAEFAACVADHLLPLAGKVVSGASATKGVAGVTVAWTLLPLAVREFSAELPEALVRRLSAVVAATPRAPDDMDLVCELVLRGCGRRLKDEKLIERARAKIVDHPARARWTQDDGEVDAAFLMRGRISALVARAIRDAFGADRALPPAP